MKRITFAFAGVALVAAIVYLAVGLLPGWNKPAEPSLASENTPQVVPSPASTDIPTPQVIAATTPESQDSEGNVGETPPVAEVADEAKVEASSPSQSGLVSFGGRGGGGGDGMYGGGAGPFTEATLTLTAPLPDESAATVYTAAGDGFSGTDLDLLREFATKMGVSGDVYFEWYAGLRADGSTDESGNGPTSYRIFDGFLQVLAYGDGSYVYQDARLVNQYNLEPLPFQERAAIAERFASEHGLLDFEYEIHATWGHEVQFLPMINGRPVNNWQRLSVSVSPSGEIISLNYRPLPPSQPETEEPLRSAQEAWEYLQEQVDKGPIAYNVIAMDPAYYAPAAASGTKINWQKEFAAGQQVDLNAWIQILRPVDGTLTPRLVTDRGLLVAANPDTLEEMAGFAVEGNSLHLTGTLSGEAGDLVLNLEAWDVLSGPSELYLSGTVLAESDQVYLELPGGFRILVANPPQDLPMEAGIGMSTWGVRTSADGCGAVTEWISIDLNYQEYAEPVNSMIHDPYSGITGITISDVDLVYQFLYAGEAFGYPGAPFRMDSNSHFVPVWRFAGLTNKGDFVEFMVPAPSSVQLVVTETE